MEGFLKETQSNLTVAASYEDLCEKVTQEILAFSLERIAALKSFTMVLSGGSTPRGVYRCMSNSPYRDEFDWRRIHFFWGDERWVPREDERSNYRMAADALFKNLEIPSENIHPIQ